MQLPGSLAFFSVEGCRLAEWSQSVVTKPADIPGGTGHQSSVPRNGRCPVLPQKRPAITFCAQVCACARLLVHRRIAIVEHHGMKR